LNHTLPEQYQRKNDGDCHFNLLRLHEWVGSASDKERVISASPSTSCATYGPARRLCWAQLVIIGKNPDMRLFE
jgi:hypothetical protein